MMLQDTTKSMLQDATKSMHRSRFWFVGLALLLSGCLLPQPDTPVIPPFAPGAAVGRAQPASNEGVTAAAPASGEMASNNAGDVVSNSGSGIIGQGAVPGGIGDAGRAGAPDAPSLAPATGAAVANATLKGRITGMTVKTVVAVPVDDETLSKQAADVDASGAFTLALSPGSYHLDVVTADKALRVGNVLTVKAGESRTLTLTLQADPPKATLTEETTLDESVAPSPGPTESPKPTPQP